MSRDEEHGEDCIPNAYVQGHNTVLYKWVYVNALTASRSGSMSRLPPSTPFKNHLPNLAGVAINIPHHQGQVQVVLVPPNGLVLAMDPHTAIMWMMTQDVMIELLVIDDTMHDEMWMI